MAVIQYLDCVAVKFFTKFFIIFPHSWIENFVIHHRRREKVWNWKKCMTGFTGIAIFIQAEKNWQKI